MPSQPDGGFRLTVLNPDGRDPEQHFPDGAGEPGAGHQPTNFHGYAACTRGHFHRDAERAAAESAPVLLLLRGDFKATERALERLKKAGRPVAVSLKETGLHQIAEQLRDPEKLARFLRVIGAADACLASTPEAADVFRSASGRGKTCLFVPTPYPVEDERWNFAQPSEKRAGIFVGTREFNVPSRNHLAALLLARGLSAESGEPVTVYNFDGRKGTRTLSALDFPGDKLCVLDRRTGYADYLREVARHKIVLQLDTSFVPGQVAGDALLCRVPCIGGNGAVDRLAFPDLCGTGRSIADVRATAVRLLTDASFNRQAMDAARAEAARRLSFGVVAQELSEFFATLI